MKGMFVIYLLKIFTGPTGSDIVQHEVDIESGNVVNLKAELKKLTDDGFYSDSTNPNYRVFFPAHAIHKIVVKPAT